MKTRELRELTTEKLNDRLEKLRGEIIEVEFDIKLGQEKDTASRGKKRKEIAKILSILNEKSRVSTVKNKGEDRVVKEEKKVAEEKKIEKKTDKKETKSKSKTKSKK
jgi:ribosomal protein L29